MRLRTFILISLFLVNSVKAQSVRNYLTACNEVALNSRFDTKNPSLQYVYDKYSYGTTYLSPCDKFKSLYNVPILRTLIQVNEQDTVDEIRIFLPFDSAILKGLEADFGKSETTWMAFMPGDDTTGLIWDKKWFMKNNVVFFTCTRFKRLLGAESAEDFMIVSIYPRRDKKVTE